MKVCAKIVNALPGNNYIAVDEENRSYTAICSGSLKKLNIYVGDFVYIEEISNVYIIKEILPRKNWFIRPRVSNIDYMVLCVSISMPKPDFMLLDKQLIMCKKWSIEPIICITKMDLLDGYDNEEFNIVKNTYEKIGYKVWYISCKSNSYSKGALNFEKGKTYAFSGNSGVGKSTIISYITSEDLSVGMLGKKTQRGKHTTKHVKIYNTENLAYVIDTPGFSGYDVMDLKKEDLRNFYPEFAGIKCKYLDCSHVNEDVSECMVKKHVEENKIDTGRYERYVEIYNILKEKEDYKYKR